MTLECDADYDKIGEGDNIVIEGFAEAIKRSNTVSLLNKTTGERVNLKLTLTERQRAILSAGGMLNYTKNCGK